MIEGSNIHEQKFKDFLDETKELEQVNIQDAIKRTIKNRDSGDITWEDVLTQDWVDFLMEKIIYIL